MATAATHSPYGYIGNYGFDSASTLVGSVPETVPKLLILKSEPEVDSNIRERVRTFVDNKRDQLGEDGWHRLCNEFRVLLHKEVSHEPHHDQEGLDHDSVVAQHHGHHWSRTKAHCKDVFMVGKLVAEICKMIHKRSPKTGVMVTEGPVPEENEGAENSEHDAEESSGGMGAVLDGLIAFGGDIWTVVWAFGEIVVEILGALG